MQIRYVGLKSWRLEETLEFYRALGLPFLASGDGYGLFRAGSTQLMFEEAEVGEEPFYHFAFDIPCNQIKQAAEWLSERVELLSRDGETLIAFPDWNATSVYFHDPMGNIVELIARENLANEAEGEFTPEMLLRVSEIGWPATGMLTPDFRLPAWRQYEKFHALGSETGLVLVVEAGRPWVPTGRPSEPAPLVLVLEDESGVRHYSAS